MANLETWDIVLRLVIGAALGGLVGLEREYAGQDAGFRTHLLLGLGSAVFGVVSVGAFDDFVATTASTNVRVDVTRIASYVAAGVGFIGGGAILKHRGTVRGITTATSLWTAAAVGLASGVGYWIAAVTATVIALVALAVLRPLSNWIDRRRHRPATLVVVLEPSADGTAVLSEIREISLPAIKSIRLAPDTTDTSELVIEFWSQPNDDSTGQLTTLLSADDRDDIRSVTLTG
ncbi:MgtC/SapB family protein [Ilumatobacter nonamiensis]|uniref:MgtC/SapB family protein n=1 Tax=Ilumatobacter nonamiensis TaxID=467093 RepID=UPI00034DF8E2|nr:MgtC/SapB family protein [Ilumatobacter nonamiensis]